jgi:predicted enzyme related to lactoylglutathione lyase
MAVPAFNSVAWFEFGTDQPEKVKEFYGELFDWNYALANHAISYVLVQDVTAIVERAGELGAEVVVRPVSDSAGLTFARLRDAGGNHFGVFAVLAP